MYVNRLKKKINYAYCVCMFKNVFTFSLIRLGGADPVIEV